MLWMLRSLSLLRIDSHTSSLLPFVIEQKGAFVLRERDHKMNEAPTNAGASFERKAGCVRETPQLLYYSI